MKHKNLYRSPKFVSVSALVVLGVLAGCSERLPNTAAKNTDTDSKSTVSSATPRPAALPTERTLRSSPRAAGLDFSVPSTSVALRTAVGPGAPGSSGAATPAKAVGELVGFLVARDSASAWNLISASDQERVGNVQRLTEESYATGWTQFAVRETTGDTVTVEVKQTPKISEIDGVVAETATLRVRTVAEAGGYKVVWSKRSVDQAFADISPEQITDIRSSVMKWAASRQQCADVPTNQYESGLIGVTGLADSLCKKSSPPKIGDIGDLDQLDEPDPILQSFGSASFRWARVASIQAPVAMNVVVAPRGRDWIVVAIARPSISES